MSEPFPFYSVSFLNALSPLHIHTHTFLSLTLTHSLPSSIKDYDRGEGTMSFEEDNYYSFRSMKMTTVRNWGEQALGVCECVRVCMCESVNRCVWAGESKDWVNICARACE